MKVTVATQIAESVVMSESKDHRSRDTKSLTAKHAWMKAGGIKSVARDLSRLSRW